VAEPQGTAIASAIPIARHYNAGGDMELINRLRALVKNEEGQDLLEYALLIALIALVCVGAVALAGSKVSEVFTNIAGQIPAGT
jgi:pilus assembly protein Flp/PilA